MTDYDSIAEALTRMRPLNLTEVKGQKILSINVGYVPNKISF